LLLFCIIIQIIRLLYNSLHYVTMSTQFLVKQIENDSLTPSLLLMLDRYRCGFAIRTPYTKSFCSTWRGSSQPHPSFITYTQRIRRVPAEEHTDGEPFLPSRSLIWAVSDLSWLYEYPQLYRKLRCVRGPGFPPCPRRELRLLLGELEYFSCLSKFTT